MAKRTPSSSGANIRYRIMPADPHGHQFRVELEIAEPDPTGQRLAMPAWIPGSYMIREFARHVVSLEAQSQGRGVHTHKIDKHTWQVAAARGPLVVHYQVYAWDCSVRTAYFDAHRAFFNPSSLCLRVLGQEDQACGVLLEPPPTPDAAAWQVATTLPEAGAARHGFGWYEAADYDALIDHPVEMGRLTLGAFQAAGARHEVAISGCAEVDLKRLTRDLAPVCAAHARLFEPETGRAPFNRYLFMTSAVEQGYGGLEHRSSTALLCSRHDLPWRGMGQASEGYRGFLGLASHEYLHAWLVKRIKPAAFVDYDLDRENYTRQLWIFEGFTSYYDELMLARAGVMDAGAYLHSVAQLLSRVVSQPGRHIQSLADSSFDAWIKYYRQDENSPNTQVSYYAKGALIALALDLTVRSKTDGRASLDDVLRLMWQQFGQHFYTRSGTRGRQQRGVPEDAFPALLREATGVSMTPAMHRWIHGTGEPAWAALFKPFGIELSWAPTDPAPSLGLKTRMQAGALTISHVYTGGAAVRSGLAAGDVLIACDAMKVDDAALKTLLARKRPGDRVRIHAFRRDQLLCVEATLAAPAATQARLSPSARHNRLRADWLGSASTATP